MMSTNQPTNQGMSNGGNCLPTSQRPLPCSAWQHIGHRLKAARESRPANDDVKNCSNNNDSSNSVTI